MTEGSGIRMVCPEGCGYETLAFPEEVEDGDS
jgi:hypothetical protein